jgi:ribonucleoside-triphosphate reductase
MKQVIKRDGRLVDFDKSKIEEAVLKCFKAVDGEISDFARQKAKNITEHIEGLDTEVLGVEEIQDFVERGLMSSKRKDVARAYITYRDERTRARNRNAQIMKTVKEKLDASNIVNQNANIDEKSFGGRRGEASNEIMKQYAIDNILSDLSRENHLNNRIYIHDLDHYALGDHNCLSVPFDELLANGFNTRQSDVRPAGSVNTACQLVAVIFQLQSL